VNEDSWREVGGKEDNKRLKGCGFTATIVIAVGGDCGFIPLVNIVRNHQEDGELPVSAREILGSLIE
jgi:3-dehydroquinate synthase class II